MEYQSQWSFSTPPVMYNTNQKASPFAANVSSYFRRPSRVIKSASRNSSPRHNGRRKTTSNAPISRAQSVTERQRSSMPLSLSQQHQQVRPMSWGPASFGDFNFSSHNMSPEVPATNTYQYNHYGTTAVNGLVTPMSYPAMDEPQIHELITPLEELSAREGQPHFVMNMYQQPQYWTQPDMCKEQGYAMDNMFPQTMLPTSWLWTHPTSNVPTAPPSPSFLPIQGAVEASPLDLNARQLPNPPAAEELVSIGLYDSPADVQSSSLLFSGFTSNPRKSMKLEESFEPVPKAEGEDDGSDEENEEDSESEEESTDNVNNDVQYPTYQEHQVPSHQPALAGQSFFFDGDINQNPNYTAYPMDACGPMPDGYQMQYPMYNWI